jgi:hypothetical protein
MITITGLTGCKKVNEALNQKPVCAFINYVDQVQILKEDSITVQVAASDPDGSVQYVRFYVDNKLVYTSYSSPYQYMLKDLLFGQRVLKVIAYDNLNAASSPATLYINVIPNNKVSVSMTAMPSGTNLLVGDSILFIINAVSSEGNIKTSFIYIDDSIIKQTSTLPFSYLWKYIPQGTHTVYAEAIDEKKHEGQSEPVTYQVGQNQAPTISISFENHTSGVPFMPGDYIGITCNAQDPEGRMAKVEYYFNNVLYQTVTGTDNFDYGFSNVPGGHYQLVAKAYDQEGAIGVSNTLSIVVNPGVFHNGVISNMTYSEDDHVVFAADKTNKRLLILDPINGIISDSVELPYANPLAISYSMQDKILYIVHEFDGVVTTYNKQTHQLSELNYSGTLKGKDVAIDPIHRRLYVLTQTNSLVIINPDNGTIIQQGMPILGEYFCIDPQNQLIFSGGDYNAMIYKYSVANDVIQQLQSVEAGDNGYKININPAGTTVVLPCGGGNGNGDGYKIYAYDATNLNNIKGKWDIGSYPTFAIFSQDNQRLFALNGSNEEVDVESTSTYSLLSKPDFPKGDDSHSVITPNYSGSVLTAFSYDSYNNNRYVIYFISL